VKRDFSRLAEGPFELLVIGGGIYGCWAAYDAALRGLKTAVIEKEDWASATSSASSKLIHGGLRYLERFQVGLVRKSLAERKLLTRLGPHRVHPLRFVLPIYRDTRVGRFRMRAGLWLYDLLAGSDQPVAPHRYYARDSLLALHPHLEPAGLRGGFTYGDCGTDDARMALEVVDGALDAGAVAVNRACATELLLENDRAVGARVVDVETNETVEVRADAVLNCAGPWGAELVHRSRPRAVPPVRRTKGVHLVMPALPSDDGVLIITHDGRVVFLIPWEGRTLLGTTDTDYNGDPDLVAVKSGDVDYLLGMANSILLDSPWGREDVIGAFAGLRTLSGGSASPSALSRELVVSEPIPGLVTPIGGKYTSSRTDSVRLVDRVAKKLDQSWLPRATHERPFPWAPPGDLAVWRRDTLTRGYELGLDEPTVTACQRRYGSRVEELFALVAERPELALPFVPDAPVCAGELVHAARCEMARTLEDVVRRRIPLVLVSRMQGDAPRRAAELVGAELGWKPARIAAETAEVERLRFDPTLS
jgi:glycerol-3-phosphate dehydrogenase